jgi:hypothetical protein
MFWHLRRNCFSTSCLWGQRNVFSYEIRTFDRKSRSSLIMFAQCANDVSAIMLAQRVTLKGQAVEVWRGDGLVYRVGMRLNPAELAVAKKRRPNRNWKARFPRLSIRPLS